MSQLKRYNGTSWEIVGGVPQEDTLPINAVVQYTGSTVPDGYELVEDYSTSEIDTGKRWIDNKTIYRKVITFGSINASSSSSKSSGISNLDNFISINGVAKANNSSNWFPISRAHNSSFQYQLSIYLAGTTINIETGSSMAIEKAYIILEYTKSI